MSFQLGIYSFGNTPRTASGGYGATAQAIRDVLEAVRVAEDVGLDFFGFGEHHTQSMPLSSPTALVNAAAASTSRIGLGTTVTVISTDGPIRVFEQLATAAEGDSVPAPCTAQPVMLKTWLVQRVRRVARREGSRRRAGPRARRDGAALSQRARR
jgi:hypothetical protein